MTTSMQRGCQTYTLALYGLGITDGNLMATAHGTAPRLALPEYSQFKYGRLDIAETYGRRLARILQAHIAATTVPGEPITLVGTPYKHVPNAAHLLAKAVFRYLSNEMFNVSYAHIGQQELACGDYGPLDGAQRDRRNSSKQRFLNRDDFEDRHVVVIDDIRITGSIERSITALLADIPLRSLTLANLVRLDPDVAQTQPHLEHELNHRAVQDVGDLLILMRQAEQYTLITRAIRFVLESRLDDVRWLLERLDGDRIIELAQGIIDDGYDQMEPYRQNCELIAAARTRLQRSGK